MAEAETSGTLLEANDELIVFAPRFPLRRLFMSPDEVVFYQQWGELVLLGVVDHVTACILYGMVVVVLLSTLVILFPCDAPNWRSVALYIVNIVCLATATIIFAGQARAGWLYVKSPLILTSHGSLDASLLAFWHEVFIPETLPFWMNPFAVVISDLVVIWRVWCLQTKHRWWRLSVPIVLLLATAVTLTLSNVYGLTFAEWYRTKTEPQSTGITFGNIGDGLSLATNLVATSLVGWRLWDERQMVTRYIRVRTNFSFAEKVLLFLVEFGAIFCLLQFLGLLFTTEIEHADVRAWAFRYATTCVYKFQRAFAIVYPTLVIVLVRTKKTFMNELESVSLHPVAGSSLSGETYELQVRRKSTNLG